MKQRAEKLYYLKARIDQLKPANIASPDFKLEMVWPRLMRLLDDIVDFLQTEITD
jgi:hypothetical protein